jgi:hypothetical protein
MELVRREEVADGAKQPAILRIERRSARRPCRHIDRRHHLLPDANPELRMRLFAPYAVFRKIA